MVFLDLKKGLQYGRPYDITVNAYGIREKINAYNWFEFCLENRIQICSVGSSVSKICSLQCGIPQGTILGPLLFMFSQIVYLTVTLECMPPWYASYLRW